MPIIKNYPSNTSIPYEELRRECFYHQRDDYILEIPNTKGIRSDDIRKLIGVPNLKIRIIGPYDKIRIEKYRQLKNFDYYYTSVIYTIPETISIISELEKIEKNMSSSWSELAKAKYFYNVLKRKTFYDPKYKTKSSDDIRTLRGLISKETVCAGYAVIYKELLDRNGIKCAYVQGNGHAWNVIKVNEKTYPIDVTWENTNYRKGDFTGTSYFCQNVEEFKKTHTPDAREPFPNIHNGLSELTPAEIRKLDMIVDNFQSHENTTYKATKSNGNTMYLTQVGEIKHPNGRTYYKYYYYEITKTGARGQQHIFCGGTNITKYIEEKKFHYITQDTRYENKVIELFSERNIDAAMKSGTNYLGSIENNQIVRNQSIGKTLTQQSRLCKRTDNTKFTIAQSETISVYGKPVYSYEIYECISDNKKSVSKVLYNKIYLSINLFDGSNNFIIDQKFIDAILSRNNIDIRCKAYGGYVGFNAYGKTYSDEQVSRYFGSSR